MQNEIWSIKGLVFLVAYNKQSISHTYFLLIKLLSLSYISSLQTCFKNVSLPLSFKGAYAPDCDSQGFYKPTQCHNSVGVCWCVDKHGVEFANTRTRGKPNCGNIFNYNFLLLYWYLFLSISFHMCSQIMS